MQSNQILSANMLDLLFDNRNKEYGAYELRKTYQKRIAKALLITTTITTLAFTGVVLANSVKNNKPGRYAMTVVVMKDIKPIEKLSEKVPVKKPETQPRAVIYTEPKLVEVVTEPPPRQDEMDSAKIDVVKRDGPTDVMMPVAEKLDGNKGIIDPPKNTASDEPVMIVEVPAKFAGNWENFLRKNLDPQVPFDNGAKPGNYTIIIQFVVDKEGNVSEIKPLTNLGFGMEDEAMRVLKKASKWEPAIQNGFKVKAYRQQPITFQVLEDE